MLKAKSFYERIQELDKMKLRDLIKMLEWSCEITSCPPCGIAKFTTNELWDQQSKKHRQTDEIFKEVNKRLKK